MMAIKIPDPLAEQASSDKPFGHVPDFYNSQSTP
jgi:hypothetical protein